MRQEAEDIPYSKKTIHLNRNQHLKLKFLFRSMTSLLYKDKSKVKKWWKIPTLIIENSETTARWIITLMTIWDVTALIMGKAAISLILNFMNIIATML